MVNDKKPLRLLARSPIVYFDTAHQNSFGAGPFGGVDTNGWVLGDDGDDNDAVMRHC